MQGKLFIESFNCLFKLEENFILTEICKIQEELITFLKRQNASPDSVIFFSSQCAYEKSSISLGEIFFN